MWFGIVSLFPEMFQALNCGITGRSIVDQKLTLAHWNPRDFSTDKHQSVDDRPYGGGPGMVMMAEPLSAAIQAARQAAPKTPHVIYLSPQGRQFDQAAAAELASKEAIILVAGRYEGIEEWSVGDYILTGGELPAMVMIDTIARLIPGVVGDDDSVTQDSLTSGLLKYPQYTRPETTDSLSVPEVLLSGHHQAIKRWRTKASLGRTWLRRPDLLAKMRLSAVESGLLSEFIEEFLQNTRKNV
jgi:tRNA (guanine37-N1)-methyltransferase